MPRPISDAARLQLWQRVQDGEALTLVAADLQLRLRTAQNLLGAFHKCGGPQPPRYTNCGRTLDLGRQPAHQLVLQLRRGHRGWGAGRIRLELHRHGLQPVPPERTIRRWLADAGLAPAPPIRQTPPASDRHRARQPHEVWQMDAAEHLRLANRQEVSWLRLVDEFTGAVLQTEVFPPRQLVPGAGIRGARLAAASVCTLGAASAAASR
jgi:hypothetical protein